MVRVCVIKNSRICLSVDLRFAEDTWKQVFQQKHLPRVFFMAINSMVESNVKKITKQKHTSKHDPTKKIPPKNNWARKCHPLL